MSFFLAICAEVVTSPVTNLAGSVMKLFSYIRASARHPVLCHPVLCTPPHVHACPHVHPPDERRGAAQGQEALPTHRPILH
jgi:hypothetical protein